MKIKKSYIIGAVIVVLLAVFIIMGVTKPDPHAGHDHENTQTTTDSHAGHDHENTQATTDSHTTNQTQPDGPSGKDLTPDKAYTLVDNKDGTYRVLVTGRSGNQISSENFTSKPTFTEVNQDVLEVADRTAKKPVYHWAKYYDIENHRISKLYSFVLATKDQHVAYVEHRSGTFYVFVSDAFDENAYFKQYKLEGIANTKSGSPEISYKLNGTTLTVTYSTEEGTNSMDIKMFAK